jgi:hypothetical protein
MIVSFAVLLLPTPNLSPAFAAMVQKDVSEQAVSAWGEVERLVAGVGGRENWAKANYYRIVAHHHPPLRVGGSHINIIEMGMNEPRMRFEARGPDLHSLRIIDGQSGWRVIDGKAVEMTQEAINEDNRWWQTHVYRMFHRLAVREPGLEPKIGKDGRLELWVNGKFEMWYRLGVDGTPYSFGITESGERWTLFGPFVQAQPGGVRYPRWTSWSDGTFRTEAVAFEVYETLQKGFSFSPPKALP